MTSYVLVFTALNLVTLLCVYSHMQTTTRLFINGVLGIAGVVCLVLLITSDLRWYEMVGAYVVSLIPNWLWIAHRGRLQVLQDALNHTH